MAVTIRDAPQLVGMIERGELSQDLMQELEFVITRMQDGAGPKEKIKGSVTLKLSMTLEGAVLDFEPDITSRAPKRKRPRSSFFVTADGRISDQHPDQPDMFPHKVTPRSAS